MKNRNKVILGLCILLFLIGGIIMLGKNTTTREKQINYLQEHEQEITDAIKKNHPKVESIQWDWDSVSVGDIGNGTPQGGGTILTISGGFNDIEDSSFTLGFELKNKDSYPSMEDNLPMMLTQPLRQGGRLYE